MIKSGGSVTGSTGNTADNNTSNANTSFDLQSEVKSAVTNLVRANIQTNNFIEEAMDLIEEDVNGTVINEGDPEEEVSDEEDTRKNTLPKKSNVFKEDNTVPKIMWEIEAVPDWGHRLAAYTADQKRFYNEMVPKINEIKGIMNSASGWDLLVDSKNDQVKIETKRSIRGNNLMRA